MPRWPQKPKNKDLGVALLKSATQTITKPKELKGFDAAVFLGLAAKLAKDTQYTGNWRIPNALKHFPADPILRTVEKYFPYAEGGPIYVDEPTDNIELAQCQRKAIALHEEGMRYFIITREMHDMEEHEALAKLQGAA